MARESSRGGLSAAELRRVLDAVDPAAHHGQGEFLPDTVLECLIRLIGCDDATFQVMDVRRRHTVIQEMNPSFGHDGNEAELLDLFRSGFWDSLSCSYPNRTGDYASVTRLSDFYTRTELSRTTIGAYFARAGIRHELVVPLPPDGELDRRVMLFRGDGPDFTDRDAMLMGLLRPHLIALHLRQRRHAAGVPELTPRQMQALRLVAAGCTNAQAARAMGVSEATVRKHMENAFSRLDVGTRTAAVAKVLPLLAAG
jgi:DNA-binding CsgD family transcriptional regulator